MHRLLFIIAFSLISISTFSQPKVTATPYGTSNQYQFNLDVNTSITNLGPLIAPGDMKTKTRALTIPFIEFGDGAFSAEINPVHAQGRTKYTPLFFAVGIYDTTRPKPPTRIGGTTMVTGSLWPGRNEKTVLPAGKSIFITPNIGDIVPGDMNNFAITYRLPDTLNQASRLKIVFYYNSNAVFDEIKPGTEIKPGIPAVRSFYLDQWQNPGTKPVFRGMEDIGKNYNNSVMIEPGDSTSGERNLFITLKALENLEYNQVTNIYVALIYSGNMGDTWKLLDDYLINSMSVAEAHDPNYIRQTGQCILLPKKEKKIKYRIHFQNDGEGEAGRVVVKVRLPWGIDPAEIKFGSANCGGQKFTFSKVNTQFIADSSMMIFDFQKGSLPFLLKGTLNNANPYVNPNTMGDIFFEVQEPVINTDTLPAQAAIYFYNLNSDQPLEPVFTNLALSVYKESCDGKPMKIDCNTRSYWKMDSPCVNCNTCYTILGICWYWWLLLLPVVIILYYLVRRTQSKKFREKDIY